jgi:hypothetical protein
VSCFWRSRLIWLQASVTKPGQVASTNLAATPPSTPLGNSNNGCDIAYGSDTAIGWLSKSHAAARSRSMHYRVSITAFLPSVRPFFAALAFIAAAPTRSQPPSRTACTSDRLLRCQWQYSDNSSKDRLFQRAPRQGSKLLGSYLSRANRSGCSTPNRGRCCKVSANG